MLASKRPEQDFLEKELNDHHNIDISKLVRVLLKLGLVYFYIKWSERLLMAREIGCQLYEPY